MVQLSVSADRRLARSLSIQTFLPPHPVCHIRWVVLVHRPSMLSLHASY
jgi:hypothetical protein